jgi:hypothetical protein
MRSVAVALITFKVSTILTSRISLLIDFNSIGFINPSAPHISKTPIIILLVREKLEVQLVLGSVIS